MTHGTNSTIIQESAGNGQGNPYAKEILKIATLKAVIQMPSDLFGNKASVQTMILHFQANRPHEEDDIVTFIDFSEDGYLRQNRKKSGQEVNLRNVDHAIERADEVAAIVRGKKAKTNYYTEANGKVIRDTITLNGDDWTFRQHQKISTMPSLEDFMRVIDEHINWKISKLENNR
jgi:type I restriction-modification system DNA methylase subunit